ncbi:AbfB domain-containing protein [Corynebacterium marquesiae]|uniref:AbfB domain-containing protein n=1 Tax=Corynebacterium marquesiae TaxID=2913503 RepID=UPI0030C98581
MNSLIQRLSIGVLTCIVSAGLATSPALAETPVNITAGDGGLVQKDCATGAEYVRIDSSELENSKACFFLTKPTGWVAVNITGSYGVVNRLKVPVSVAFKLPDGDVYWQRVVEPGKIQSTDVGNNRSTVVEMQVTPVATSTGAGTGDLSVDTANPHVISMRSAGRYAGGKILRLSWAGVELSSIDRNSGFNDRLDASFKVVPARDGSQCLSLEAAAYPGVFLTMHSNGSVAVQSNPNAKGATWCPASVAETPTGTRLASALNQNRVLTASGTQKVATTTSRTSESVWFIDQGLALPGK